MSDVPVVEESKPVEVVETPAVSAVDEHPKTEETPAVTETSAAAVEETPATTAQDTYATEEKKDEATPADTKRPKSPSILTKLLASFKNDNKKTKAPKSPTKKEKEKDKKKEEEAETPATEEAPKPEVTTDAVETPVEPRKEELPKEPETPAAETSLVNEAPKEYKASKIGRRLSARVADLFVRKSRSEVPTTAKVEELPPKIDEPKPVAPLENPATETVAAETPAKPSEATTNPIEPVPTATPIVAAAA